MQQLILTSFVAIRYKASWALIKFLDLGTGRLFEVDTIKFSQFLASTNTVCYDNYM